MPRYPKPADHPCQGKPPQEHRWALRSPPDSAEDQSPIPRAWETRPTSSSGARAVPRGCARKGRSDRTRSRPGVMLRTNLWPRRLRTERSCPRPPSRNSLEHVLICKNALCLGEGQGLAAKGPESLNGQVPPERIPNDLTGWPMLLTTHLLQFLPQRFRYPNVKCVSHATHCNTVLRSPPEISATPPRGGFPPPSAWQTGWCTARNTFRVFGSVRRACRPR